MSGEQIKIKSFAIKISTVFIAGKQLALEREKSNKKLKLKERSSSRRVRKSI